MRYKVMNKMIGKISATSKSMGMQK